MNDLMKCKKEMFDMAEILKPYTFPKVELKEESTVFPLREKTVTVDGYEVIIALTKADYGDFDNYFFSVCSEKFPFIPFSLVCKLGRFFLGSENLSYIEFFKGTKKTYSWIIRIKNGKPLPPGRESEPISYEGFDYSIINPNLVDYM